MSDQQEQEQPTTKLQTVQGQAQAQEQPVVEAVESAEAAPASRERRRFAIPPPEQRVKPVIPEGMSKKAWKKEQKRLKFLEQKDEFQKIRKEKKLKARAKKRELIQELAAKGESYDHLLKKTIRPEDQIKIDGKIIIDCGFDDLMTREERNSLSTQLTRSYSAIKNSKITPTLKIANFNKLLKKRFDEDLKSGDYKRWINVEIDENELTMDDPSKYIYLSSDASEDLTELDPNMNYIIGGIVDKGRYKNLCYDKSQKLGVKSYRLPIDEFIKLYGRRVLTTTHVVELLLKWHELKDWKQAFELVLPQRKQIKSDTSASATPEPTTLGAEDEDSESEDEEAEEAEEEAAQAEV